MVFLRWLIFDCRCFVGIVFDSNGNCLKDARNDGWRSIEKWELTNRKFAILAALQEVTKIKDNRQQPQLTWDANMKVPEIGDARNWPSLNTHVCVVEFTRDVLLVLLPKTIFLVDILIYTACSYQCLYTYMHMSLNHGCHIWILLNLYLFI